jgi:hypothetical protein
VSPDVQTEPGKILVVPQQPGPLVVPEASEAGRSELDDLMDELFGPDVEGGPGRFDVALLIGGLILVAAGMFWFASSAVVVVGVVAMLLGAILPVRTGWRALNARRAARRRRAAFAGGLPLNVGHPLTRSIADSYEQLLREIEATQLSVKVEAGTAAHAAVVEVATLLRGATPTKDDEAYVQKRLDGISALAAVIQDAGADDARGHQELARADAELERSARVEAGAELEALGLSAVNDLETLTRAIRSSRDERDA